MRFVPPHDIYGEGERLAFIIHGILGSRRNWASFARGLSEEWPEWRFITLDLRNHGDSPPALPPHTVDACADDLNALAAEVGRPEMVVGHSFGGKVALAYARDYLSGGEGAAEVWALDSTPGPSATTDGEVERVIEACRALPQPAPDRDAVRRHFSERGFSKMLAGWMTTNVERADDGLVWRFDLDGIAAMLADYRRQDLWPLLEAPPAGVRLHVLRAGRSDRWSKDDLARLERAPIDTPVLADAGHWVHVDDPAGLRALLADYLSSSSSRL